MAHSDILTEDEYSSLRDTLNYEVIRYLEYCRQQLGLSKQEIRILDYGCGRGPWVAHLLELGYVDVKGVDIAGEVIERGRDFFNGRGYDIDRYCSTLDSSGNSDFPDDSFHFIFSTQVFEHVSDLKKVASELARVTLKGGMGLHIYPAHRHLPVEGHLFMPLVHWLPKNQSRKKLIQVWTSLGVEPRWQELDGMTSQEKADVYYKYSVEETFYRHYNQVVAELEKNGLSAEIISIDHPAFTGENARLRFMRTRMTKDFTNWILFNFKTVEILTTKLS